MQGKLPRAQGELLMYTAVVKEAIEKGEIGLDYTTAMDSLIEGGSFSEDDRKKLVEKGYMDDDYILTDEGILFVEEQIELEQKESREDAEAAQRKKDNRIDRTVNIASAVGSVVGSATGEFAKRLMGGNQ